MLKEEQLLLNILDEITAKYNELFEENQRLLKELSIKAHYDNLTGVYNRFYFEKELEKLLQNQRENICIVFIDIDNFKYVNDNFGHNTGDKLLSEFARELRNFFKGKDLIGRYGGDEFVIAMRECNTKNIKPLLEKLVEEIQQQFKQYQISISIGVSFFPDESKDLNTLIKIADKKMYEIKKTTKNGVKI
jgi:diguanylate cyclase (GGDEF)-like protein